MRALVLVLVVSAFAAGTARAEKVKANQPAKLLNHPGEQGKVLYNIKEGQNMTVIGKEGRWLKVRVGGRTGYVPRSKVEMSDNEELARNTRRRPFVDGRSTHRGFDTGQGPDDRVGADATGDNAPAADDDDKGSGKKAAKDDDEDKPKKAAGKKAVKDDDDEDKPKKAAGKKAAKDDDDEDKPKKAAGKKAAKDDDEDKPKKGAGKKAKDDDDVSAEDDEDAKTDDKAADAPEEEKEASRPMAHVTAKMKVYAERDKESDVQFTAKPSDTLYPTDTKGKWTMVETDEGDAGWVLTSDLDLDDGGGGGGPHKRTIDLNARFGVTFLQQGMRTAGTTLTAPNQVPDVYNIGTSAATISLGARLLFPYGKKYFVGGEATYDASKTLLGGFSYMNSTTGLTLSDLNVRAVIAYPTQRKSGLTLLGRLGFRYRGFLVDNYQDATKNPAKIPQETLKAPTLGVAMLLPMLTDKVGLQIGVEAILFGASITQTAGLEDGATPSMSSEHVNVGIVYRFKKQYNLCGAYDLDYASYDFGTPNMGAAMQSTRGHTGTDVARTDIIHTVSFGVEKLW
jgi:hypothetical protein